MQADPSCTRLCAVRFLLEADASPGLLPRLLQPFAKRDLTPDSLSSHRLGETMHVAITLHHVEADIVHVIEGNLRQVIGVVSVIGRRSETLRDVA